MRYGGARGGQRAIVLTDETFSSAVDAATVALVDFWAPWCVPCRMVGHAVEALAQDAGDRLLVARLNVDENPHTPKRLGVENLPTLLVFRDGRVVDVLIGAVSKPSLDRFIRRWIESVAV